jgi:hypothetical protein
MTESSRDDAVSASGGTMRRLTEPPRDVTPDLALLEPARRTAYDVPVRPAGTPPFFAPGDVVTWHYGMSADVVRVVGDDERGLVAWLPSGSESLASVPLDGRGLRDLPLNERFSAARRFVVREWQGPGIIRIAATGVPWSIWYFFEDDGRFHGHYLNLELTHRRPADAGARVHTRDLILDLWVEGGDIWLKDADGSTRWSRPGATPRPRRVWSATSRSTRAASRSTRVPGRSTRAGRTGCHLPSGTEGSRCPTPRSTPCRNRASPFDAGAPRTETAAVGGQRGADP